MFITKKEFESITLISFYSKMQPLFCLVPTNLSTQFPSWHELTQRPHNSAISVPDLKWSYFAFKGSEQLELPLNWNRIGPLGIEVNEKIFHSVSIFQYPLSQAAADLQPYGCFIYIHWHVLWYSHEACQVIQIIHIRYVQSTVYVYVNRIQLRLLLFAYIFDSFSHALPSQFSLGLIRIN